MHRPHTVRNRPMPPRRRVPCIPTLLLCAGAAAPAFAIDKSWNAGSGNWNTSANWSPVGVPGAGDAASIGDLAGISNGTVTLNVNSTVSALEIVDGMTLRTSDRVLTVSGATTIAEKNVDGNTQYPSTLRVQNGAGAIDFTTVDLFISDQARLLLQDGAVVRVNGLTDLETDGEITGRGVVNFHRAITPQLVNDGHIRATSGGLTLASIGAGRFDLDGVGDGIITADTRDGTALTISGIRLEDSFSGEVRITSESELNMLLDEGWTADPFSLIDVEGILDVEVRPPARIAGAQATFAGQVHVGGFSGHLEVDAPAILEPTLVFEIDSDDRAAFLDATTINGGQFFLASGAEIDFDGPTTISGGTFETFDAIDANADVDFNGPTTWEGDVTFNGRAAQHGDARVDYATVIDAEVFDIGSAAPSWDINASFTINTTDTAGVSYAGFDIGGGLFAKLTVNIIDGTLWGMAGFMNLTGYGGDLYADRVGGSMVLAFGAVNAEKNVDFTADAIFMPMSSINLADADTDLRFRGETFLREGMSINGSGWIRNGEGGVMKLYHTTTLGAAGLSNDGELTFFRYNGLNSGVLASVDRFANEDDGTLRVRIGGPALGDEHDHIVVTGGSATLDGNIAVDLLESESGYFAPSVGDEFNILTAVGGVSGTFDNVPVTMVDGITYTWTVIYEPNSVVLRVEDIDICPADLAAPFGVLNLFDFLAFQTLFSSEDPRADLAPPFGTFNLFDFLAFQTAFGNGC